MNASDLTPTLQDLARIGQVGIYVQLSMSAAVIYDHLTTFDLEVELIWKRRRWSFVQFLFIITRYVGDAANLYSASVLLISSESQFDYQYVPFYHIVPREASPTKYFRCRFAGNVEAWLNIVALWAMQGVVMYRILAMYHHGKRILFLLLTALVVEAVPITIIQGIFSATVSYTTTSPAPNIHLCNPTSFPTWYWTWWLPVMLFEIIIFVLSLLEGIKFLRESHKEDSTEYPISTNVKLWRPQRKSLIHVLIRDSIVYPFLLIICLVNILAWCLFPLQGVGITLALAEMGIPILGCRLILNLRDAYYRPFTEEFAVSSGSGKQLDEGVALPLMPIHGMTENIDSMHIDLENNVDESFKAQ